MSASVRSAAVVTGRARFDGLLPGCGSVSADCAVARTSSGPVALAATSTVSVTVAVEPPGSTSCVHCTCWPVIVHVPTDGAADTGVVPAGRVIVEPTVRASDGPLSVVVTRNVAREPATSAPSLSDAGSAVTAVARSAAVVTVTVAVVRASAGVGSGTGDVAVIESVSGPGGVAASARATSTTSAEAFGARVPTGHVTREAVTVQATPPTEADTGLSPAGRSSTTSTAPASEGPVLVTRNA